MKRLLIAVAAAALCAAADFRKGLEAYNHGDFAAAQAEWQPMAESGDANAQYNLALLYARQKVYAKAAEWYGKASEQGVLAAQYNLGVLLGNGDGVPQNMVEAIKWLTKSAEAGVVPAQLYLGNIYQDGQGVPRDYAQAMKWYQKAAGRGLPAAQFNLGVMYDLGQGVPRDDQQAVNWYRKAADQGYTPACTNIGILYYNAQGVKRDVLQAYAWFKRAADAGDALGKQLVTSVRAGLNPRQLHSAEQLAANWHPVPPAPTTVDENGLFLKPAEPVRMTSADREALERTGAERIIAVGDVYGDFEQFVAVLESARLIDSTGNWIGGKAHLVQTGNILDRGPDGRRVMDLLIRLDQQARAAGGGVHCLLGKHEAMNIAGDLSAVSALEAAPGSPAMAEYKQAIGPDGTYGQWLRSLQTAVLIDRTLFAPSLDVSGAAAVDRVLKQYGVDRIVTGNGDAVLMPRFGGKVLLLDNGLARIDGRPGRLSCLEIEGGRPFALYRGQRLDLPTDDGADMLRYLKQNAALDP